MSTLPAKCAQHPSYAAKNKPKIRCYGCWAYYIQTQSPKAVLPKRMMGHAE